MQARRLNERMGVGSALAALLALDVASPASTLW